MSIPFPSSSLHLYSTEYADSIEHNSHQAVENQKDALVCVNDGSKVKPKSDDIAPRRLPNLVAIIEELRTYHEAYLKLDL